MSITHTVRCQNETIICVQNTKKYSFTHDFPVIARRRIVWSPSSYIFLPREVLT